MLEATVQRAPRSDNEDVMTMKVYSLPILAVLLTGLAYASGDSTPLPEAPSGVPLNNSSFRPTAILDCAVLEVRPERTLVLQEIESRDEHVVRLEEGVEIKARRKKDFDGRRRLEFSDLSEGQEVKVTVEADTGRLVEVRVMGWIELGSIGARLGP